jgi:hypothetical protein
LDGAFVFVVNGAAVGARPSDAAALSPAVALQLSVDACVRTFVVDDGEVNAGAQSPVWPPFPDSVSDAERRSLSLLFRRLWNSSLERESLFAGTQGCVRSLPASVSLLSVDAIDWSSLISRFEKRPL